MKKLFAMLLLLNLLALCACGRTQSTVGYYADTGFTLWI